jgi:hypothetical protein
MAKQPATRARSRTDVSHAGRDAAPLQHVVRSQCHNDIIRFAICFIFDAGCS